MSIPFRRIGRGIAAGVAFIAATVTFLGALLALIAAIQQQIGPWRKEAHAMSGKIQKPWPSPTTPIPIDLQSPPFTVTGIAKNLPANGALWIVVYLAPSDSRGQVQQ